MSVRELTPKTDDELLERLNSLSRELMNLRFQRAQGTLENPARLRTARRERAGIKTVLRQRRAGDAVAPSDAKETKSVKKTGSTAKKKDKK